jgi:RNA polymerase sigma-70 factor (ECF subfamily)
LIVRDVLGWPAAETASFSRQAWLPRAARSSARATMREHLPARRAEWHARTRGEGFARSVHRRPHERCDAAAAVAAQDIRITMPPEQFCVEGIEAMAPLLERGIRR